DLVGTGVVEVFALERNLRATVLAGEPLCKIQRRGAAYIMGHVLVVFCPEGRIAGKSGVDLGQLFYRGDQGLADKHAAVTTKMALVVRAAEDIGRYGIDAAVG